MSLVHTVIFFLIACVTSLILTAVIRWIAPRIGFTDLPDGHRKLHERPMALGGGISIFLSTFIVVGPLLLIPNSIRDSLLQQIPDLVDPAQRLAEIVGATRALLLAGGVIVVVGLIDDRIGLSGRQKLCGQLVATSILMVNGLLIERVGLFGLDIDLGPFCVPFTLFWLLGAINALNLLDGIDGLCTIVGIILVSTIAAMAVLMERPEVAIVAAVFAGSLVGFIRFNFPPASIFLGDTGSMLIGLVVGTLAIQGSMKGAGTVLLAAPLAIWAIPIFDSAAAILRRKLTGRSIYATDRGHLHHRLLNLLGSNRKVLAWLTVACTLTSAAALLSVFLKDDRIALCACAAIVIVFIATGVFGRAEFLLLGSRLRKVGRSLVPPISVWQAQVHETSIRLQGSRRWELLWETFTESADKLSLCEIRLDVDLPAAGERYHGSWERPRRGDRESCWRIEFPLIAMDRSVGRLLIVGEHDGESTFRNIQELMELIEPLEVQLATDPETAVPVPVAEDGLAAGENDGNQNASVLSREHPR